MALLGIGEEQTRPIDQSPLIGMVVKLASLITKALFRWLFSPGKADFLFKLPPHPWQRTSPRRNDTAAITQSC